MGNAAIAPLGDLNIIRDDIPEVLADARTAGSVRRAFLKGIAVSERCPAQASVQTASLIDALE